MPYKMSHDHCFYIFKCGCCTESGGPGLLLCNRWIYGGWMEWNDGGTIKQLHSFILFLFYAPLR